MRSYSREVPVDMPHQTQSVRTSRMSLELEPQITQQWECLCKRQFLSYTGMLNHLEHMHPTYLNSVSGQVKRNTIQKMDYDKRLLTHKVVNPFINVDNDSSVRTDPKIEEYNADDYFNTNSLRKNQKDSAQRAKDLMKVTNDRRKKVSRPHLLDWNLTSDRWECYCGQQFIDSIYFYRHIQTRHIQFSRIAKGNIKKYTVCYRDPQHNFMVRKVINPNGTAYTTPFAAQIQAISQQEGESSIQDQSMLQENDNGRLVKISRERVAMMEEMIENKQEKLKQLKKMSAMLLDVNQKYMSVVLQGQQFSD